MTRLRTQVSADVRFRIESDGREPITGELTGRGSNLTLTVSDPEAFAGGADAGALRRAADELAEVGVRMHVLDGEGTRLLSIGDVRSPWWQRMFTRSAHLRVVSLRGLLAGGRGRARGSTGTTSGAGLVPPGTPYPLAPMFLRRPVKRVTTTHDPGRGGLPRLVELPGPGVLRSDQPTHWLQGEVTTFGSDPGCDVVLEGLAPLHAEVRHDHRDELVLVAHDSRVTVGGQAVDERLLRTGVRVDLGPRSFTFVREEYADHGRPHGGRIGGELGRQRPQPPRPEQDGAGPPT